MNNRLLKSIIIVFAVSVMAAILILGVTSFHAAHQNAIVRSEKETRTAVHVFTQNMDYYIDNCVNAARSVYSDSAFMTLLEKDHERLATISERNQILNYLRSIFYACASAEQIYFACPNLHQSFLYDPTYFTMTYGSIDEHQGVNFSSYLDIRVTSVHKLDSHGHTNTYTNSRLNDDVLTIWMPIYDLPKNSQLIAWVGIDVSSGFLMSNSLLQLDSSETVYITDGEDLIMSSSSTDVIGKKLPEVLGFDLSAVEGYALRNSTLVMGYEIPLQYCSWRLWKTVPLTRLYDHTFVMIGTLLIAFILLMLTVFIFNAYYIKRRLQPLRVMTDYMQRIAQDPSLDFKKTLTETVNYRYGEDEISELISTFDRMLKQLEHFRIREYELELAYDRSTLKMLQAQINPHFIYNTLQCFATNALRRQDREQYRMMTDFGQMLHYAMVLDPWMATLRQELDYVERYVKLQAMRFGSEDSMVCRVSKDAEKLSVPKMCLQPLVENAIVHGGLFRESGSRLEIEAGLDGAWLHVRVMDNGTPVTEQEARRIHERLKAIRDKVQTHHPKDVKAYYTEASSEMKQEGDSGMIGVENVYYRLLLAFSDAEMRIGANDWDGTTVSFSVCLAANTVRPTDQGEELP